MDPAKIQKLSTLALVGLVLALPGVGYWASQIRFGTAHVQQWLPGDDVARENYRQFLDNFGDDQILLMSWPGCRLDDPRLEKMSAFLRSKVEANNSIDDRIRTQSFTQNLARDELSSEGPGGGILSVSDSASMLQGVVDGPSNLTLEQAKQRMEGIAIGMDGTCFIAMQIDDAPSGQRAELIDFLRSSAEETIGVKPSDLILAGDPFQVYIIDRASRDTMKYFVAPSSAIALLLAWLCFRNWRITCLTFALAGLGQLLGLALITFFLREMSAVLVVLPTLIFMLTLSAAVHLINYYQDCGGHSTRFSGERALQLGARPCLLATITTVFGFGSLAVSQLTPVWQFGSLASLGLLITTSVLLLVFPSAVRVFCGVREDKSPTFVEPQVHRPPTNATSAWLSLITQRYSTAIISIGLAALAVSAAGLAQLRTSTEFDDMFLPDSAAVVSLRWMETKLGPINSLEFVVAFPIESSDPSNTILDRVLLLEQIHGALEQSEHISSVMSAVSFLPDLPKGIGTGSTIRRAVMRRKLDAGQGFLEDQHLMVNLPDRQLWRLSTRVRDLAGDNYRAIQTRLLDIIRREIDSASRTKDLTQRDERQDYSEAQRTGEAKSTGSFQRAQPVTVTVTGLRAVIEKAHFALLSDLGSSFMSAFVLIAPLMMAIVRSVRVGLLLMLPNVLPVALVFGIMGWLQVKLDVASILTASVALGIAVDDTLHFVIWFSRSRREGFPAVEAVSRSIAACARPMLHTSIICTGSMLPFFFSDFLPTSKFALLMMLILGGAIVGDLILLPALLQTRWGERIGRNRPPSTDFSGVD